MLPKEIHVVAAVETRATNNRGAGGRGEEGRGGGGRRGRVESWWNPRVKHH